MIPVRHSGIDRHSCRQHALGPSSFSVTILAMAFASCGLLAGCSSQSTATAGADTSAATDTGSQTVSGKAPASRNSFPSIVVLEPIGEPAQLTQGATPSMDQEQQTFVPSLLLVRTGQPVNFLNHDDVLHNVRVRDDETKESAFNVAIPTGETYSHTFKRDGFYDVGCDIHPGMSAQIVSTSSPYTVLADPSGTFTIPDVPNGPYKAIAYSGADTITKEINVAAGAAALDLSRP